LNFTLSLDLLNFDRKMSKKFFRPPPQQFEEDDSEDDDDSDEEEPEEDTAAKSSKRNTSNNANLSDEEEDEEEDSEEEEERQGKRKHSGGPAPSKKKPKAASFFDMEAEASEDDDDDEAYGVGKDSEQMDEEARELIRQQDLRRARSGRFGDRSVAEITKEIESRHRMNRRTVDRSMLLDRAVPETAALARDRTGNVGSATEPEVTYTAAVAQQSLVPSVSDPSFWMVSCLTGKEQELVLQIMNKCTAFARQGRPLGITAVIAAQSKGKIYVESFSEPAVIEAIQGVRSLMQYSMRLVPIGDMTTVMTVVSKKKPVKKNDWVRMTRSHYKGDLALVKQVKESGLKCIVQCVPRLDLTLSDLPPEEARTRRRTVRPPMKFFNPQDVAAMGRQTLRRQRFPGLDIYCDYFEGNYYHDGYLLKEMTVGSMVKPCTDDDPPTLDELQSFQRRKKKDDNANDDEEENEGSKMAASLLDELSELQGAFKSGPSGAASGGLMIGDTVEIVEGDLVGMRGKLVSLDGNTVKVQPNDTSVDLGGTNEIEFLANQVRKYIAVGAHVKVTAGRYANETGVVVAVDSIEGETDCTAVILTDVTNKEISLRTSQLRESAEVASGQDKLSGYELYDLVVLSGGGSANEVGVIVRVGREDFTVVNNHGMAREVRPEELRGKRNSMSARAVALDVQGNQIRVGDSVNIVEGTHKGKTATIKRMSRAQLFLHSQTRSDHAGIFVVRSRSCIIAGLRSQNRAGGANATVNAFAPVQGAGGGAGARGKKTDGLIGKTVRVQAGQWKGYIGTISDTMATQVQVELHSRLKKVLVPRDRVLVIGDKFGETEVSNQVVDSGYAAPGPMTMATPMHALGGATPAIHGFGGATPLHETDEVWRPGGAVDRDAIKTDDGWGASENDRVDMNANEENDDGWGTSGGISSTWVVQPPKKEEENTSTVPPSQERTVASVPIKREQPSAMETEVADVDEAPVWFMERVCVKLNENDRTAIIKDINPDKSALVELDDKSTKVVRIGDMSMLCPAQNDTVLVSGGNEVGLEGLLVCVDGMYIIAVFRVYGIFVSFSTFVLPFYR
jgi:transcription elongation factor SPT5